MCPLPDSGLGSLAHTSTSVPRPGRGRQWPVVVLGVVTLLVGVVGTAWVSKSPLGRQWGEIRLEDHPGRSSELTLFETLLGDVGKPLLVLASLGLVLWCYRQSRRRAVLVAALVFAGNVTVQAVKHSPLDPGGALGTLNPLSGHAALVGALCLAWLLVVPSRRLVFASLASLLAIGGVCLAVMMVRWHDPLEVVCPVLVCLGWALVVAPWLRPVGTAGATRVSRWPALALGLAGVVLSALSLLGGALSTLSALSALSASSMDVPREPAPGMDSAAVLVVGVCLVAVAGVLSVRGDT